MNKQFLAKYRIESDEFLSKFSLSIIRFNASASSKDQIYKQLITPINITMKNYKAKVITRTKLRFFLLGFFNALATDKKFVKQE